VHFSGFVLRALSPRGMARTARLIIECSPPSHAGAVDSPAAPQQGDAPAVLSNGPVSDAQLRAFVGQVQSLFSALSPCYVLHEHARAARGSDICKTLES